MGRKRKYHDKYEEAAGAIQKESLPHKIKSKEPGLLHKALYMMFRRNRVKNIGISEEKDGIWIWEKKK